MCQINLIMFLIQNVNYYLLAIQWTYQTCTEFGFYQTSNKKESIFGDRFRVEFFIKQCEDFYGQEYDTDFLSESIKETNDFYGALRPKTSNVIYVHGSIDPWHALGLTASNNTELPIIYIEGISFVISNRHIQLVIFVLFFLSQELLIAPICMNQKIPIFRS